MWSVVFSVCLSTYLVTAHWYGYGNADSVAAAWPGWQLAHFGNVWLEHVPYLPDNPWFVPSGHHIVSNRTPGVVLIAVPAQFLMASLHVYAMTPAVLTASLLTAAAMANLCILMLRTGGTARLALACTSALAFGTGFWCNASAELWTHGPDAFWLSLALLGLQRNRQWLAAWAFAPAIMTRPHLALVAASAGAVTALDSRSVRPLLRIGLPSAAGVAGLVFYNDLVFGRPSVTGGYTYATKAIVDMSSKSWAQLAENLAGLLVSPLHGLLVFSPFVVLAVLCVAKGWPELPVWNRGLLTGAALYLLLQLFIDPFSGGTGFYSYRLPLEGMVLATPAAYSGYVHLRQSHFIRQWAQSLVAVSVAIHIVGVFWYHPFDGSSQDVSPWTTSGLFHAAQSRGPWGFVVAIALFAVTAVILFASQPPRRAQP